VVQSSAGQAGIAHGAHRPWPTGRATLGIRWGVKLELDRLANRQAGGCSISLVWGAHHAVGAPPLTGFQP